MKIGLVQDFAGLEPPAGTTNRKNNPLLLTGWGSFCGRKAKNEDALAIIRFFYSILFKGINV